MTPRRAIESAKRRLTAVLTLRVGVPMKAAVIAAAKRQEMSVGLWVRRSLQDSLDAAHYADPANRRIIGPAHHRINAVRIKGSGGWSVFFGGSPTMTGNSFSGEVEFGAVHKAGKTQ